MKKLAVNLAPVLVMIGISGALAPVNRAQVAIATRIVTVPEGITYTVDGTEYHNSIALMWPQGSQHKLWVMQPVQDWITLKTRYTFRGWQARSGTVSGNPAFVTADAAVSEYRATFLTEYLVSFRFVCGGGPCNGGSVVVNGGQSVSSDADIYLTPGPITLTAVPNEGFGFAGWQSTSGAVLGAATITADVAGSATYYPVFTPLRPVSITTSPNALQVMADGSPITSPYTLQWSASSLHPVDVSSPQMDREGKLWMFDSWSDGGAQQHAYQVPASGDATLTANFVRGITGTIRTSPMNLSLTIDGRNDVPPYYPTWRAGDTHRLEAPAEQPDSQGRVWTFAKWSNGVTARAQDFKVPVEGEWPTAIYSMVSRLEVYGTIPNLTVKVDGVDCATPCILRRPAGTQVRVSAVPSIQLSEASRAEFTGWTGAASASAGDWTATLNGDPLAIWANYRIMNRLTAVADPEGSASWSVSPASADGFYEAGTRVSISVTPAAGYRFARWSGEIASSGSTGVVAMTGPRYVRAISTPDSGSWAHISNAAGETPKAGVAPGSVVSIFGAGLASSAELGPSNPLRQTLAGVTARVGDRLLPLYFVSPEQINVQLPQDLGLGKQRVTVTPAGMQTVSTEFTVVRNAPGVFTYLEHEGDEEPLAIAFHEDGTLVTTASPARIGELLTLYTTGLGPTDHQRPEGFPIPATPPFVAADPVTVVVGETAIKAEQAFAAAGSIGVDIVRFRIGEGAAAPPAAALRLRVQEQESNSVKLPVR